MAEPLRFAPPLLSGLERRSSLGSLADTLPDIVAGVRLDAVPFPGLLMLHGQGQAFTDAVQETLGCSVSILPQSVSVGDGCELLCLSSEQWLVVLSSGQEEVACRRLRQAFARHRAAVAAVTDVSDAYEVFHLYGPRAQQMLARDCPFDVRDSAFPAGMCCDTFIGGVPTLLQTLAGDSRVGVVVYRLYIEKSRARFMVELFCRDGDNF